MCGCVGEGCVWVDGGVGQIRCGSRWLVGRCYLYNLNNTTTTTQQKHHNTTLIDSLSRHVQGLQVSVGSANEGAFMSPLLFCSLHSSCFCILLLSFIFIFPLLLIQLDYTDVHVPVTGVDSSRPRLLILQ